MDESLPNFAQTWDEATDEHGVVVDESLPRFVYDEPSFRRWQYSLGIAARISKAHPDSFECRNLARYVFETDAPTEDETLTEGAARRLVGEIKRTDDGKFARKGVGQVLHRRGDKHAGRGHKPTKPTKPIRVPSSPGVDGMSNPFAGTEMEQLLAEAKREGLTAMPIPSETTHRILGVSNTTVQKFAPNAPEDSQSSDYFPERQALHNKIVRSLLRDKTPEARKDGVVVPLRAVLTAGGTASGKSTLKDERAAELDLPPLAHTVHIDADEIKKMIPEYEALKAADDHYAAMAVHRESGDIAQLAVIKARRAGLHLVLDGTGNHAEGQFAEQLTEMNDSGYQVDVAYVDRPTVVSLSSMLERARTEQRYVPFDQAIAIHQSVSANFQSVANLPFLHALRLFGDGRLVAQKLPGDLTLQVEDQDRLNAFLSKANGGM